MAHPLAQIIGRRDRVLAAVTGANPPPTWDGPAISNVAAAVLGVLPPKVQYSAVYRSFLPLIGTSPDRQLLRRVAHAIAGDVETLRADKPVWPLALPTSPTEVTFQVVAARRLPPPKNVPAGVSGFQIRYRVRVVAGPGCPLEADTVWSSKYVRYVACHPDGLGFQARARPGVQAKGRPYQHYATLVGMIARADLSRPEAAKVKLDNVRCSDSLRDYNRALTEMRWRSTFACPGSFTHPCHDCDRGQDACPAACHPQTLTHLTACPACGRSALTDPYWASGVCTRCDADGKRPRRESPQPTKEVPPPCPASS